MPDFLCEEMKEYIDSLYGVSENDRIFPISKSYLHHEMDRGAKAAGVNSNSFDPSQPYKFID